MNAQLPEHKIFFRSAKGIIDKRCLPKLSKKPQKNDQTRKATAKRPIQIGIVCPECRVHSGDRHTPVRFPRYADRNTKKWIVLNILNNVRPFQEANVCGAFCFRSKNAAQSLSNCKRIRDQRKQQQKSYKEAGYSKLFCS